MSYLSESQKCQWIFDNVECFLGWRKTDTFISGDIANVKIPMKGIFQNYKWILLFDPVITLQGIYPKCISTKVQNNICTRLSWQHCL